MKDEKSINNEKLVLIGLASIYIFLIAVIFFDLGGVAKRAKEASVFYEVLTGVMVYYLEHNDTFPKELDKLPENVECNKANRCFAKVIPEGFVAEGWEKIAIKPGPQYKGPVGNKYIYDSSIGQFYLVE